MNSFGHNKEYEEAFTGELLACLGPLLAEQGVTTEIITDLEQQKRIGDLLLRKDGGRAISVDIKAERRASRNLFFERASNDVPGPRFKQGWGYTLEADRLWYSFADAKAFAVIGLEALRKWLWAVPEGKKRSRLQTCTEITQSTHAQKNRTTGVLVPFEELPAEVFRRGYLLGRGSSRECTPREFVDRLREVCEREGRPWR